MYSLFGDATMPTQNAKTLANMTYNDTVAMSIGRKFNFERSPSLC